MPMLLKKKGIIKQVATFYRRGCAHAQSHGANCMCQNRKCKVYEKIDNFNPALTSSGSSYHKYDEFWGI